MNGYGQLGLGDTTHRSSYTKVNYMNKNNTDDSIPNEAIETSKIFQFHTIIHYIVRHRRCLCVWI